MRNIVPSREAEFPETFKSLWLNGPDGGLDSCNCLISRVPPGHKGPRLHTHPVDQFYFVTSGTTTVQIGRQVFSAGPGTLVHFPAGTPHCNWNETDDYETHFELMVPRPPPDRLIEYWEGEVPEVPGATGLIRRLDPAGWPDRPFAGQHLVGRAEGSAHARIYAARSRPGGKGPALHFHDFDQLYYIYAGSLDLTVGHLTATAQTGALVVLPQGCVHTNCNAGAEDEFHLAILIPEPETGAQFDFKVDIQYEAEPDFK